MPLPNVFCICSPCRHSFIAKPTFTFSKHTVFVTAVLAGTITNWSGRENLFQTYLFLQCLQAQFVNYSRRVRTTFTFSKHILYLQGLQAQYLYCSRINTTFTSSKHICICSACRHTLLHTDGVYMRVADACSGKKP